MQFSVLVWFLCVAERGNAAAAAAKQPIARTNSIVVVDVTNRRNVVQVLAYSRGGTGAIVMYTFVRTSAIREHRATNE